MTDLIPLLAIVGMQLIAVILIFFFWPDDPLPPAKWEKRE